MPRDTNRSQSASITSVAFRLSRDAHRQALASELVDDAQHPERFSVVSAVCDEVVGPDMVGMLRPKPDAGVLIAPESPTPGLLVRNLQPLASPDPLDPLVVDQPAGPAQQLGDLAIAVAAILPGQVDGVGRQPLFIVTPLRDLALRRAMLAERRTGAALGDGQLASNMLDAGTATRGA